MVTDQSLATRNCNLGNLCAQLSEGKRQRGGSAAGALRQDAAGGLEKHSHSPAHLGDQQRTDPCTVPGAPQPSVRAHQGTAMSTKSTQGHSRLLAMFARCLFSSCKVRAHRSGAPCILWGLQRGTRAALGVQGEH